MSRTLVKNAIFQTFREAVIERGSLDITIKELCQLCEVNRNTFYYHFASLEYLILWGFRKGLSTLLEKRFDKSELVYSTESALDDDWNLAFYVDRRNPDKDLRLTNFWRTLDECLLGDAEYYRIVFKGQSGAFLPHKHTSADLMNYMFGIYYRQIYLDIVYASERNPEVQLSEEDLILLSTWFTNASVSVFFNVINEAFFDSLHNKLSLESFDNQKFMNYNSDLIKLLFSPDTFLTRGGTVQETHYNDIANPVR